MIDNDRLSKLIDGFRTDQVEYDAITSIIDEYNEYPLYIIKYVSTHYPVMMSRAIVNHIINTDERKCELMDCILMAHGVKVCDIKSMEDFSCLDTCLCYSRDCWKQIYRNFLETINHNPDHFLLSYNVYHSITILIAKTDVIDSELPRFLEKIMRNPKNWRTIIRFIRDTELYGSEYGDIIFNIRDIILHNDSLNKQEQHDNISRFQNRALLGSVLRKYNEMQQNMSRITDNVYITDINGAKNVSLLRDKNINCVVSLTKKSIFKVAGIKYVQIMIDDIGTVDFVDVTINTVEEVNDYIKDNKIILVHCYKGVSRSVSFVIMVLVKQGMSFQEAYDLIKRKRGIADPNPAFIKQIIEFLNKKA